MAHLLHLFGYCPRCGSNDFFENDIKSKRCDNCGFVFYFNAIAATVALIINKRGELLVARRAKEPAMGTLDLPGGFADSMETAEEGVAREVMEETGLHVTKSEYIFSLPNKYVYSGFEEHTLDLFFRCEVEDGCTPVPHDDVSSLTWMSPRDINLEEFGLQSIREGVRIFLEKQCE